MIEGLAEGVDIDVEGKVLRLNGIRLPVAMSLGAHPSDPDPPHTYWFSIPAGENGWWMDLGVTTDGVVYAATGNAPYADEQWRQTPELALQLWADLASRADGPVLEEHDSMFAGVEPGTWIGYEPTDPERLAFAKDMIRLMLGSIRGEQ